MKRILMYVLLVFALLLLGGGGYALYVFKFKEYDVADPEVKEIVEDPYVLTLPDGTEIVIDKDGEIIKETKPKEESSDDENAGEDEEKSDEEQNPSTDEPAKKQSVADIKQKYMPTLKGLEAQANGNINALINKAIGEYQAKKKKGEKIDFGYFYNKYMSAASSLEANTDAAFNSIITLVEKDLEANGYDKGHAQSLRDEYEAAKEERRSNLLKKAKEAM